MKTNFTQGEWLIDNAEPRTIYCDNKTITSSKHVSNLPITEQEANAKLIAAAPNLLEALNLINESGVPLSDFLTDKMIAAIKKATE